MYRISLRLKRIQNQRSQTGTQQDGRDTFTTPDNVLILLQCIHLGLTHRLHLYMLITVLRQPFGLVCKR